MTKRKIPLPKPKPTTADEAWDHEMALARLPRTDQARVKYPVAAKRALKTWKELYKPPKF
jgi:hypothetical protein